MKPATPLQTFLAKPTAANAVELAASDYAAGKMVDWQFVTALRQASTQCNAYPKLVEALREHAYLGTQRGHNAVQLLRELGELE